MILRVRKEACALSGLNQLVISTGEHTHMRSGGKVDDLECRRSVNLGWNKSCHSITRFKSLL